MNLISSKTLNFIDCKFDSCICSNIFWSVLFNVDLFSSECIMRIELFFKISFIKLKIPVIVSLDTRLNNFILFHPELYPKSLESLFSSLSHVDSSEKLFLNLLDHLIIILIKINHQSWGPSPSSSLCISLFICQYRTLLLKISITISLRTCNQILEDIVAPSFIKIFSKLTNTCFVTSTWEQVPRACNLSNIHFHNALWSTDTFEIFPRLKELFELLWSDSSAWNEFPILLLKLFWYLLSYVPKHSSRCNSIADAVIMIIR